MSENELGKFLKHLRGKKSLRKYAEFLDISHAYLDNLEKGDPRTGKEITPSIDVLQKISRKTGYTVDELLQLLSGESYTNVINYHDIYLELNKACNEEPPSDEEIEMYLKEKIQEESKSYCSTINKVKYEIKNLPNNEMSEEYKNTLSNMVDFYNNITKNSIND